MLDGGLVFPAFQLAVGQVLCWQMPEPAESTAQEFVIQKLSCPGAEPGLHVMGRVAYADPARLSSADRWRNLLHLFSRPLLTTRLQQLMNASRAQAEALLRRHGVHQDARLGTISQNPRVALALEVAWAQGADVVLFGTAGCDDMDIQTIYRAVAGHLSTGAAIEFCHPVWIGGRQVRGNFPEGISVEVKKKAALSFLRPAG